MRSCGSGQSRGYSAHIGQVVEIHHRWHALYGRTVRRLYGEKRSGADVVVVEGEPGAAIVVAAWMLDPAVCAAMAIGAPHVSVTALVDLHLLLMERGLRRSFSDDTNVVEEAHHEECVPADCKIQGAPATQYGVRFDSVGGISAVERSAVIARLARLLMEAAGVESKESGDDGR